MRRKAGRAVAFRTGDHAPLTVLRVGREPFLTVD
jgi:hypothetical protein